MPWRIVKIATGRNGGGKPSEGMPVAMPGKLATGSRMSEEHHTGSSRPEKKNPGRIPGFFFGSLDRRAYLAITCSRQHEQDQF
jgi:hypothetical protein